MQVQIHLDHPHEHYTNLDVVSGKVLLQVPGLVNVSSIVVKLEGEARTRLMAPVPNDRRDRAKPVLEVHKFLYKTQVVWPSSMSTDDLLTNAKAIFPITPGHYEYPFQFKLPLNAACKQHNSLSTNVSFSNMGIEVAKTPTQHIKTTLPPSLSGFPGEADIKYYAKVTVTRPQFFKENPRAQAAFTFLPIEPPRPTTADGEAYARRQHQFLDHLPSNAGKEASWTKQDLEAATQSGPKVTPRISVDARLPNPAILTLNQEVPLRILVKNVSERTKNIYLQTLQIELIGYTKVSAHGVTRTESNSWILSSMSNMAIPIGSPTDAVGTEVPINAEYWSGKPVPNTIPPSFQACNLSRFYELEARVGVGYGSYEHGKDQLIILSLRLPVKVYSGIAPPKALLDATLAGGNEKARMATSDASNTQTTTTGPGAAPTIPPRQGSFGGKSSAVPPAQVPSRGNLPGYEDAPPSYEEAVGADLPPINGYRGSYLPPPEPEGTSRLSDEKRR